MDEILKKEAGLGLAAPQVGQNLRLVLVRLNFETPNELILALINPEIISFSKEIVLGEEGCLSLPKMWGQVLRSCEITVKFQNLKGKSQTLKFTNLNARIIQHEVDHLDGILFIDRAAQIFTGEPSYRSAITGRKTL